MITKRVLLLLLIVAGVSFSVHADMVIPDDVIVPGVSDGNVPAYDCSAATLPFIIPSLDPDPSAAIGFISAGDPIVVPEPDLLTCDFSAQPWICEFTCTTVRSGACVGLDCIDGEPFDDDELKLKENNLHIRLHDTSVADVLGQSWNMQANAVDDGGLSYFDFRARKDTPVLSDGTAPAYDCDDLAVTPYPPSAPPSIGFIPAGEPIIQPTLISESCVIDFGPPITITCLHTCNQVLVAEKKSVLTLGTAGTGLSFNQGVAMGRESAVEDGAVTVGRAELLRRIANVAAGASATDALTMQALDSFSVFDLQTGQAASLLQQIDDLNAQLDELELLVTIEEIDGPAIDLVEALSPGEVTSPGNQNAFVNFLSQAIAALQADPPDLAEAIDKLEKSLARTDGCVLRGSPDTSAPRKDWIIDCAAQAEVYAAISAVLGGLTE